MYISIISLIFYRYMFFKFSPADFVPSYWINMGAMAISTLAGSVLIENAADAWFLEELLPFLKGFTIFFWAAGTWWIPLLIVLVVWRHVYRRFPLRYDPAYWSCGFSVGDVHGVHLRDVQCHAAGVLTAYRGCIRLCGFAGLGGSFIGLVRKLASDLIPALNSR